MRAEVGAVAASARGASRAAGRARCSGSRATAAPRPCARGSRSRAGRARTRSAARCRPRRRSIRPWRQVELAARAERRGAPGGLLGRAHRAPPSGDQAGQQFGARARPAERQGAQQRQRVEVGVALGDQAVAQHEAVHRLARLSGPAAERAVQPDLDQRAVARWRPSGERPRRRSGMASKSGVNRSRSPWGPRAGGRQRLGHQRVGGEALGRSARRSARGPSCPDPPALARRRPRTPRRRRSGRMQRAVRGLHASAFNIQTVCMSSVAVRWPPMEGEGTRAEQSEATRAALRGGGAGAVRRARLRGRGHRGDRAPRRASRAARSTTTSRTRRTSSAPCTRRLEAELAQTIGAQLAAGGATDALELLRTGVRTFLDACTDRSLARITLVDAPSVLGWQEWREIDERHGLGLVDRRAPGRRWRRAPSPRSR